MLLVEEHPHFLGGDTVVEVGHIGLVGRPGGEGRLRGS